MSKVYPSQWAPIPIGDLENWNLDRTPDWPVMIRGGVYKNSASEWIYNDGQSRSYDASFMRVSAIGVSVTTSPLSADSSSISARSDDGGLFRISAVGSALESGGNLDVLSGATKLENSAHVSGNRGVPIWAVRNEDGTDFSGTDKDYIPIAVDAKGHVFVRTGDDAVSSIQPDASVLRTSTFLADNPTITGFIGRTSSIQLDAAFQRTSAIQGDAAFQRVSALGCTLAASQSLSSRNLEGTAFIGSVSCKQSGGTAWLVSAHEVKQSDAASIRVSAIQGDAANQRTSCFQTDAALQRTSSIQGDAGLQRTSAIQGDAANQRTSTFSGDSSLMRTSSYLPVDTVGSMTAFRSLSLSASQAIKATAGSIYGYYLWNTTTVPQYIKFTNTSGAINVGTDVPVFMAMLPASAAANVWFGQGIKGFTAGIGVHATSAVADNATTAAAASAVGGTIFYN